MALNMEENIFEAQPIETLRFQVPSKAFIKPPRHMTMLCIGAQGLCKCIPDPLN